MTPHKIDARGLLCPLPVIRLQDASKTLSEGSEIVLIGTDPGIMIDVPAWCRIHGHRVVQSFESEGEYHIRLILGQ